MMSDISQLQGSQFDFNMLINSIVNAKYICDYGVVISVNSNKTVNVTHAVIGELIDGTRLQPTQTNNIEVIFPSSASFGMNWTISVGDKVLLIGLQNTMSVQDPFPINPIDFIHYGQNQLKAIPLGIPLTPPAVQINEVSGKIQIKNAIQSMYNLFNDINQALNVFSNATSQAAISAGGASSVSLAAALVLLMASLNTSILTAITDMNQLMEA